MKFASHLIAFILCFQLAGGPAMGQIPQAAGVIGGQYKRSQERSATEKARKEHSDPNDPTHNPLGELTEGEKAIRTVEQADDYVQSFIEQTKWFNDQCAEKKSDGVHIKWDTAYVLQEKIPYADMDIKNCAQEHEKLSHMYNVAKELSEKTSDKATPDARINKNCSDCLVEGGTLAFLNDQDKKDYIPPGDKCSLEVQAKMAAEKCSLGSAAKAGLTSGWSCLGNLLKGIVLGLKDSIVGIGKLLWEGLKFVGNKAGQAAKSAVNSTAVWLGFKKAETKADQNILAVSKRKQDEYNAYKKNPESWLKRAADTVLEVLKEFVYIGMYERESKCMNCKEKGQLLCEIGGRVINDIVGFTTTLGFGYGFAKGVSQGALKALATKLGPKLTSITARIGKAAAQGGVRGALVKAALAPVKLGKGIYFIGNQAIQHLGTLSKKTQAAWAAFKKSDSFQAITNAVNSSQAVAFLKSAGKKAAVPGRILLAPVKWTGKQLARHSEWEQKMFARGAYAGARFGWVDKADAVKLAVSLMPKAQRAEVVLLEQGKTRSPTPRAVRVEGSMIHEVEEVEENASDIVAHLEKRGPKEEEWRVWEVPASYLDADRRAEYATAGIKIAEQPVNGVYKIEMENKNFGKLLRGDYATKRNVIYNVPVGKDKVTIARYGDKIEEIPINEMTRARMNRLEANGAVFTTKEHLGWNTKINPNGIDPKWLSTNLQDQGKIAWVEKGKVRFIDAKDMPLAKMKELENDKNIKLIEHGFDNPKVIAKWTQENQLVGEEILGSAVARNFNKAPDQRMEAALETANNLQVSITLDEKTIATAQKNLSKSSGVKSKILEGIDDHELLTEWRVSKDKPAPYFEVDLPSGETVKVPVKHGPDKGLLTVQTYQDGKRMVVRTTDQETHLFELSKGQAKRVATIPSKESKNVERAMGELYDAKLSSNQTSEQVIANLKSQGKKEEVDFFVRPGERPGEQTIEVKVPNQCNKRGAISIECQVGGLAL